MTDAPRRPRALAVAAALLATLAVVTAWVHPHLEGDTVTLLESVAHLRTCLQQGEAHCPAVSASSLQQMAIVGVAQQAGLPAAGVVRMLALLSGLSVAALVLLATAWLDASAAPLGVALLATSPLVYYARSTFGEALATLSLTLVVLLWRTRRAPWWALAAAAMWAALGKDTLAPFVIGLAMLATWLDLTEQQPGAWRRFAAVAFGAVLGAATFATLHQYRVGAPVNTEYVGHPEFFLSSPVDVGSAFLGHWLSPAAGLVWFWPAAMAVLCTSGRSGVAALALLAIQAAGLSTWWSPYGWVAWGDRLMYPLAGAASLLCLTARRDAPTRLPPAVWILAVAAVLATTAMLIDNTALGAFFAPDDRFPGPPTIQADVALYRDFLRHLTWRRWFDAGALAAAVGTPAGLLVVALQAVVAALTWNAWRARAGAPARH